MQSCINAIFRTKIRNSAANRYASTSNYKYSLAFSSSVKKFIKWNLKSSTASSKVFHWGNFFLVFCSHNSRNNCNIHWSGMSVGIEYIGWSKLSILRGWIPFRTSCCTQNIDSVGFFQRKQSSSSVISAFSDGNSDVLGDGLEQCADSKCYITFELNSYLLLF